REEVVAAPTRFVALRVVAMEAVRGADAAQVADRAAQVHVVARDHEAATELPEPADARAVLGSQAVTAVDGEEPKLVVTGVVQVRQHGIRFPARGAIACSHLEGKPALVVPEL